MKVIENNIGLRFVMFNLNNYNKIFATSIIYDYIQSWNFKS